MKVKVKLTKRNVNAYKAGQVYDLESNMANYLIKRGLAEEVEEEKIDVTTLDDHANGKQEFITVYKEIKEEKKPYETKEEKHKAAPKATKRKKSK